MWEFLRALPWDICSFHAKENITLKNKRISQHIATAFGDIKPVGGILGINLPAVLFLEGKL